MISSRLLTFFALPLALMLGTVVFGQTADTVYHNGSILTMAGKDPAYVEALAVKDGKIVFAGPKAEAVKRKTDTTRMVDLRG